jgi:hypothetical protein
MKKREPKTNKSEFSADHDLDPDKMLEQVAKELKRKKVQIQILKKFIEKKH